MKRYILSLILLVGASVSTWVPADEARTVQVLTGFSNFSQCISPVHVLKIDGREVAVQPMGFRITPGRHTLSGRANVDSRYCPILGRFNNRDRPDPLEFEFEAGKIYYMGFDHSSPIRENWKYVIWRVRDED